MPKDNVSGAGKGSGCLVNCFLIPGKVIQWFMYMGTAGVKGDGKVRAQTRMARSPVLCWIYSILFWGLIILFFLGAIFGEA